MACCGRGDVSRLTVGICNLQCIITSVSFMFHIEIAEITMFRLYTP